MDWNMLNGTQIWVLNEAIMHAFPDPALFDTFLFTKLNKDPMRNHVAPGGYTVMLPAYLQFVRGDGWIDKLVARLQREKPNNPLVRNLARAVRLAGAEPPDRLGPEIELEAIAGRGGFTDVRAWLRIMAEISEATCRIESPAGNPIGTGVLVAPDYVLTNYHVAKLWTNDANAVCRFGYARNAAGTDAGELQALAPENAKVASSVDDTVAALFRPNGPVLDYALLKLAASITKAFSHRRSPVEIARWGRRRSPVHWAVAGGGDTGTVEVGGSRQRYDRSDPARARRRKRRREYQAGRSAAAGRRTPVSGPERRPGRTDREDCRGRQHIRTIRARHICGRQRIHPGAGRTVLVLEDMAGEHLE
ncbi:effector-associated domain EAD1-containing protein [Mesorhizobium sp.]|uniref:effector-associated domain EAD1-containing protein n=1 Tax=Mesorhizobium sp. TaxID=1871066 RepID=UPI0011FC284C|nr:effector-associated domain EAD1-containing protein [Mesorhizobium sp.]TIL43293.1 MAG: S1 family peptidase [Mesorhizobium sp.]